MFELGVVKKHVTKSSNKCEKSKYKFTSSWYYFYKDKKNKIKFRKFGREV